MAAIRDCYTRGGCRKLRKTKREMIPKKKQNPHCYNVGDIIPTDNHTHVRAWVPFCLTSAALLVCRRLKVVWRLFRLNYLCMCGKIQIYANPFHSFVGAYLIRRKCGYTSFNATVAEPPHHHCWLWVSPASVPYLIQIHCWMHATHGSCWWFDNNHEETKNIFTS